jgi:hypothetical protein
MKKQVRSIKGEMVNFDLSDIKNQIEQKAPTTDVKNREKYVFSKRRRGSKKAISKAMEAQAKETSNKKEQVVIQPSVVKEASDKKETKKKIIKKKRKS